MIDIKAAVIVKKRALAAIAELDAIVSEVRGQCPDEEFQTIKRSVGLAIGKIITDLLEPVLQQHPEIDDLKN